MEKERRAQKLGFASRLSGLSFMGVCLIGGGCASESPVHDAVLQPVVAATPAPVVARPTLEKLLTALKSNGMEGVGLEFESDSSLEMLYKVFTDKRSHGRRIKQIYTGMALAYDPKAEALTVGGPSDPSAILQFISKIPLR